MVDITKKTNSLRIAIASALLTVSREETMLAINDNAVPKGNVFEFSRAAGLLAIKKTSDVIPDCHPLPIEFASITHSMEGLQIRVTVEVHTIYKTGVEVEAMHGAAITALTMYDMLKPIDKGIEISQVKLENKSGGKSQFPIEKTATLTCVVVVCSDTVFQNKKEDSSGKLISEKLSDLGLSVEKVEIIADEHETIQQRALHYSDAGVDLLLFVGGTGLSYRDVTPDAIRTLLTREIPGVMETARAYGQQRMPYAMLSRGVCGFIKDTLVLTLPGSPKGSLETVDAVFPHILHVFKVAAGERHQ